MRDPIHTHPPLGPPRFAQPKRLAYAHVPTSMAAATAINGAIADYGSARYRGAIGVAHTRAPGSACQHGRPKYGIRELSRRPAYPTLASEPFHPCAILTHRKIDPARSRHTTHSAKLRRLSRRLARHAIRVPCHKRHAIHCAVDICTGLRIMGNGFRGQYSQWAICAQRPHNVGDAHISPTCNAPP